MRPPGTYACVPNLYPIVDGGTVDENTHSRDLRQQGPATGVHEVAVLSPAHHRSLAHLDDRQVLQLLLTLQDRARAHADAGHRYTQLLVNHGVEAGASLTHPHAQIVAIDIAPPAVEDEMAHIADGDGCVVCRELERIGDGTPLWVAGQDAVDLVPLVVVDCLRAPGRPPPAS